MKKKNKVQLNNNKKYLFGKKNFYIIIKYYIIL